MMQHVRTGVVVLAVIALLTGCAGRQVRELREQNQQLALENAALAERLEAVTGESIRLSAAIDSALRTTGDYLNLQELEREHLSLVEENRSLRDLLEQAVAAAQAEQRELPEPVAQAAAELGLFRAEVSRQPLPRDTGGAFVSVPGVDASALTPPDRRSPLANSGIVMEEVDGVRRYYDAVVNRTTPQALFLVAELPRTGSPRLLLVVNERYSRTEPPLAFRRVIVGGEAGLVALPVSAGSVTRRQDDRYRFERVEFPFSSAAEAAVRLAIESEFAEVELGGIGSVSRRPISDAERTALTNVLYAFDTLATPR